MKSRVRSRLDDQGSSPHQQTQPSLTSPSPLSRPRLIGACAELRLPAADTTRALRARMDGPSASHRKALPGFAFAMDPNNRCYGDCAREWLVGGGHCGDQALSRLVRHVIVGYLVDFLLFRRCACSRPCGEKWTFTLPSNPLDLRKCGFPTCLPWVVAAKHLVGARVAGHPLAIAL